MSEEAEKLGRIADRVDNLNAALRLPLPAREHVEQLQIALPQIVHDLRAVYVALTGDDPWDDGETP